MAFVSDASATGVDGAGAPIAPHTDDPADYDHDDHDQAAVTGTKLTGAIELWSSPTGCAGWNHTFAMTYTNSTIIPLTRARLVIPMPALALALPDQSSPDLLGSAEGPGAWELGTVGVGETVVRRLELHLFSRIANEAELSLAVLAEAFESDLATVSRSVEVRSDGRCAAPAPTLTPTATPTVMPTPGGEGFFLPLIMRGG